VFTDLGSVNTLHAFDGRQFADNRRANGSGSESGSEEAVLGTFHLKARGHRTRQDQDLNPDRPEPSLERTDESPRDSKTFTTIDFVHLFADARAAQDAGDIKDAQRLFERVIALRPNSELADEARQHLSKLYRVTGNPGRDGEGRRSLPNKVPSSRTARATPERSGGVYGPQRPDRSRVATRHVPPRAGKQQRSRRLVMLERQFIADIGDRIFFAKGSTQLGARAHAVLVAQAEWLKAHPELFVTLEGHADDGADQRSDQRTLSLARAEAVRRRLIAEGVHQARMASQGRGSRDPVAACASAECAAQNRRVVTVISADPIRVVGKTGRPARPLSNVRPGTRAGR